MAAQGVERYSIGTHVKLHTHDNWNNLYGVVDDLVGDTIAVYCINMPLHRYFVSIKDAGKVLEFVR